MTLASNSEIIPSYELEQASIPTCKLFLNPNNIRLFCHTQHIATAKIDNPQTQEDTRRLLLKSCGVKSLIDSILKIGFLPLDQIVVLEFAPDKYMTVEGNRRLAAIKTILGDTKRRAISPQEPILSSINKITTLKLSSHKQHLETTSLTIQGARHISGVRNWRPYQQGYLLYKLTNTNGNSIQEAARTVGLNSSRANILLHGYYGMQQMIEDSEFSLLADTSLFNCFEQAYAKTLVREWLGWDDQSRCYTDRKSLRFFYRCITSTGLPGSGRLLAREIRSLLPEVLGHKLALDAFCSGKTSIQEAHAMARAGNVELASFVKSASRLLEMAESGIKRTAALDENERYLLARLHELTGKLLQHQTSDPCPSPNASCS